MPTRTYSSSFEHALAEALAAKDFESAIALIDQRYLALMGTDFAAKMDTLVEQLPEEAVEKSLWANVSAAVACEMARSYRRQRHYFERIRTFAANEQHAMPTSHEHFQTAQPVLCIMDMLDQYHQGNFAQAVRTGQAGLDRLDEQDRYGTSGVHCMLGMVHFAMGDVVSAHDNWRRGANLAMVARWTYSMCLTQFGCAMVRFARCQLDDAAEVCHRVLAISDQGATPVLSSCYAHLLLARIHYERNNLDEARTQLDAAHAIAQAAGEEAFDLDEQTARAHMDAASGQTKQATERANRYMAGFARTTNREGLEGARAMMAGIWMHTRMPRMAGDCLDTYWDFDPAAPIDEASVERLLLDGVYHMDFRNVWHTSPLLEYLHMRIEEGKLDGVDAWLELVRADASRKGLAFVAMETAILQALCAYAQGDVDTALVHLSESLVVAEEERCIRSYADMGPLMEELLTVAYRKRISSRFLAEVRDAMRQEQDGSSAPDERRFTKREMDVMRLLCQGLTNSEMAKRLFLGLSTVKNHTHSIYQKLGVRNRAEAIARIHDLGIVE